MAKRVNDDDSKVFDVSKPGKGKVMATSRPVITASEVAKDPTVMEQNEPTVKSPSQSHKVIQPLTPKEKISNASEEVVKVKVNTAPKAVAAEDNVSNSDKPAAIEEPDEKIAELEKLPVEEEPVEDKPKEEPEQTDSSTEVESSDAAALDAVAGAVASKKEAAKAAEEKAKRDARAEELTESKKYFVKIGHEPAKKDHKARQRTLVTLLVFMIILTAAYLAVDAGLVDVGVNVPFELVKD